MTRVDMSWVMNYKWKKFSNISKKQMNQFTLIEMLNLAIIHIILYYNEIQKVKKVIK